MDEELFFFLIGSIAFNAFYGIGFYSIDRYGLEGIVMSIIFWPAVILGVVGAIFAFLTQLSSLAARYEIGIPIFIIHGIVGLNFYKWVSSIF